MLIGDIVRQSAERWPGRTALVSGTGSSLTYSGWNDRINRFASALIGLGLRKGDRVGFYLRNVEALATAYLATHKLGAVAVPLNYRLRDAEIALQLNDCQARLLIYEQRLASRVEQARPRLETIQQFIVVGGPDGHDALDYELLVAEGQPGEPALSPEPDDISTLMYTGGTTGLPKAVVLTHRKQWLNAVLVGWEEGLSGADRVLFGAPLYHAAGYSNFFLPALMMGGCAILIPTFEPDRLTWALAEHRATVLLAASTVYAQLSTASGLTRPAAGWPDLRLAVSCASTVRPEAVAWAREQLTANFMNIYGLTETVGNLTMLEPAQIQRLGPINCIGRGVIGMDTRVARLGPAGIGDPNVPAEPDEVGELVTRGPKVMVGYLNRPDQTAQRIRDGWLHTGDLVRRDEDNYVYYLDRLDDAIRVGGETVYPKEVERLLDEHPLVRQSAVVGVSDPTWGQVVKAYVVAAGPVTARELRAYCRGSGQLASFKLPRFIELVEEIPMMPSGKVLKRELLQRMPPPGAERVGRRR